MTHLVLLFAYIVASLSGQHPTSIDQWHTLDEMCGRLVRDESYAVKANPPYSIERLKDIHKAVVRLYPWREDSTCCKGLLLVAETRTGWSGQFEFKKAVPGDYWLAAYFDSREYTMAIRYTPAKSAHATCTNHTFTIEKSGDFTLRRTIEIVD